MKSIDGKARTISEILQGKRYGIDYYQREYRFEPGHPQDGVTILVPIPLLAGMDREGFDWLVPGGRMVTSRSAKSSASQANVYAVRPGFGSPGSATTRAPSGLTELAISRPSISVSACSTRLPSALRSSAPWVVWTSSPAPSGSAATVGSAEPEGWESASPSGSAVTS